MAGIFPSATDSRNISDLKAIHTEVCAIETAILDAREQGLRTVTVCDTDFTNSVEHWVAFTDPPDPCNFDQDQLLSLQNQVLECFTSLGYSIVRKTDLNTNNTFCWVIRW